MCQSTPALGKDDNDTYYEEQFAETNMDDPFGKGFRFAHKSGVEIECDLIGQYVDIVIDMSEETGNGYEFQICSFAVLGEC